MTRTHLKTTDTNPAGLVANKKLVFDKTDDEYTLVVAVASMPDAVDAPVDIDSEAAAAFLCGQTAIASASATQVAHGVTCKKGVLLKSLAANTGKIYVQNANTASSTTGFELSAGDALFVPSGAAIWARATVDQEKLCWEAV